MGLAVPARVIIKFLSENGFEMLRIKGSHYIYGKNGISVPVPVHKGKDVSRGTLKSVLDIAGYTVDEFEKWLGR